jgi:SAM-dependent methyltransferase
MALNREFIPPDIEWVHSHYFSVPEQISHFCGDIRDANVLDVGCGEMLSDFGLLRLGIRQVTGLDLIGKQRIDFSSIAGRLERHGISPGSDYASHLRFAEYDGQHFPFENESFDVIVSWSAFEHVNDVPQVLHEMKRVARPRARVFVQVCPWFQCLRGSHLSDFITEPYFHPKRSPEWVLQQVNACVASHPEKRDLLIGNLWPEFRLLNKYSANRFYADVAAAGFTVQKAVAITYEQDFTNAPRDVALSDLMIYETKMLLRP